MIKPLKENKLINEDGKHCTLTENGLKYMEDFMSNFDYFDVHLSDTILLAMAEDVHLWIRFA